VAIITIIELPQLIIKVQIKWVLLTFHCIYSILALQTLSRSSLRTVRILMTHSQALLPNYLYTHKNHTILLNISSIIFGVLFISALAQIAIPVPFSPVPITGQTFGVLLLALTWGKSRAAMSTFIYFSLGTAGLPIFAASSSGLLIGPTFGYLIGMFFASVVVGHLADHGYTCSFKKALLAVLIGNVVIYFFGLLGLSFFIENSKVLALGLIPFIPGGIAKAILAAGIATKAATYFSPAK
jgi:biotin transport system substrate-specific component